MCSSDLHECASGGDQGQFVLRHVNPHFMKKSLRRPFRAEIVRRILNERKAKMLFFQRLHTKTNGRKYNQNTPGFSMKKPATRAGSDGLRRLPGKRYAADCQ